MLDNFTKKIKSIFIKEPEIVYVQKLGNGISARMDTNSGFSSGHGYGSGSKWPAGTSRGTPIDIFDHFSVRQKVRNLTYDSIEGRALIQSIVDTTVDIGLRLKPTPISDIIKKLPEELELWSEKTAMMFHLWAQSKKSHRSRINNFYQNQKPLFDPLFIIF